MPSKLVVGHYCAKFGCQLTRPHPFVVPHVGPYESSDQLVDVALTGCNVGLGSKPGSTKGDGKGSPQLLVGDT